MGCERRLLQKAMSTVDTTCPVCGYDGLEVPTELGEICSCCGTEFGFYDLSYAELRSRWIANGSQWWSRYMPPLTGWSAEKQLYRAGFFSSVTTFIGVSKWRLGGTELDNGGALATGQRARLVAGAFYNANTNDYFVFSAT